MILVNYSGHGLLDLSGYESFFKDELTDFAMPDADFRACQETIADLPKPEPKKSGKW